jgi:serine/threonine protein kinase
MSPEYIDNRMISEENDMFSLGVIIFHIMAGDTGYNDYRDLCPHGDGFIEIVRNLFFFSLPQILFTPYYCSRTCIYYMCMCTRR